MTSARDDLGPGIMTGCPDKPESQAAFIQRGARAAIPGGDGFGMNLENRRPVPLLCRGQNGDDEKYPRVMRGSPHSLASVNSWSTTGSILEGTLVSVCAPHLTWRYERGPSC